MYLRKVHIENIRSITELDWEIPEGSEAGWHVMIGDNGAGKSTFLRAIALVLVGQREATALRQNWNDWVRKSENHAFVELGFVFDPNYDSQFMFVSGRPGSIKNRTFRLDFERESDTSAIQLSEEQGDLNRGHPAWANFSAGGGGWFSAAYGPFRRFSGGDQESQKIFETNPRLAAHLSIFGENIALTESLKWLLDLDYRQAKNQPEGVLLDQVKAFVNQEGFLPHQARLTEISPDGVIFTDGDRSQVPVEELSDGYRSVLSMTFELIRQMARAYPIDKIFSPDSSKIILPGVVLIDEVDAHLHPTWQRRIGLWFREHFPNIQFIVTTHSPLVCQAAEHGTVWRLPKPGSGEKAEQVTGVDLDRLLYGDVLDAYGTELFGENVGRSEAGQKKMQRLAELNAREVNLGLSKAELAEQQSLRAVIPAAPYKPSPETAKEATNGRRREKRK